MKKVMVYGTGTMGTGIAQVLASSGVEVLLVSARGGTENSSRGKGKVGSILDRAVQKGKETAENAKVIMDRIKPVADMAEGISGVDMLIEAATEEMELKKEVFRKAESLDPGEKIIFATNSSALSITELATVTKRTDRFLGVHFFNPAPVMPLVEVVKGAATDEDVVAEVVTFIESLGKSPIVVSEAPGFVVNRIRKRFFPAPSQKSPRGDNEVYIRPFPPRKQVIRELQELIDRGVKLFFIYSGGITLYYNYADQFFDMFRSVKFKGMVFHRYFREADHTYTIISVRQKLMSAISEWISYTFP